MPDSQEHKRLAAEAAVAEVRSGMVVGLGSGSTAVFAIRKIASLLASRALDDVRGVPTSRRVAEQARTLGIPLVGDDGAFAIDLAIDGADEVDPRLDLIKGGGGALLREKIVAQASARVVIVVDESKLSHTLGARFRLPVEVVPFGWQSQANYVERIGGKPRLRVTEGGGPLLTDQGNYVLDCDFGPIAAPAELARLLESRAGIVEHGLFLNIASTVIAGGPLGVRRIERGR